MAEEKGEREYYCPLANANSKTVMYCDKEKCQWWIRTYTTEGGLEENCAIVILAMKNSEGFVPA